MIQQKDLATTLLVIAAAVCFLAGLTVAGQWYETGPPNYQQGNPGHLHPVQQGHEGPQVYHVGPRPDPGPNPYPGPDSNQIWGHPWVEDPPQYRFTGTDAASPYGPSMVGIAVIDGFLIDLSLMVADMIED